MQRGHVVSPRRREVLIRRDVGGLGDILVHRMIFEDVALAYNAKVHFACPSQYVDAVQGHPHVAEVLDCRRVDPYVYKLAFDTSTACLRHEARVLGPPKNRSDIWAAKCGVVLSNHDMHLGGVVADPLPPETVVIAPLSAQVEKSLSLDQIERLAMLLRRRGLEPLLVHSQPIRGTDLPQRTGMSMAEWMSHMKGAPRVISVDTSHFHLAGGLGRPLVGLHAMHDGSVIGQHYQFTLFQVPTMADLDLDAVAEAVEMLPGGPN